MHLVNFKIKEAVEVWKSNKQQKLDDAKKRKAEREKQAVEASASADKDDTYESTTGRRTPAEALANVDVANVEAEQHKNENMGIFA